MQPFVYDALPGRVVFANGAFDRVPDELDRLGGRRVLLIADRSGTAWADRLASALGDRVVGRIDDVRRPRPGRARRGRSRPWPATLGGRRHRDDRRRLGDRVWARPSRSTESIPILAVPTTYAGSEMTPIWGLTEGARKTTGRDARVQPRTVVYDPVLTLSLPPSVAGPSGMNALAHCAEALYADGANPITSLMAERGIARPRDAACRGSSARPTISTPAATSSSARTSPAAAFASAGSGIHHKICHVLGGAYDLPHAETHTVILPHALALIAPAEPEAIARIAAALGGPDVPGGRVRPRRIASVRRPTCARSDCPPSASTRRPV